MSGSIIDDLDALVSYRTDRVTVSAHQASDMGWCRTDERRAKLSARWLHVATGWRLEHCGHPTALTPWALYAPTGTLVLAGVRGPARRHDFGTAWPNLLSAMVWHRAFVAGRLAVKLWNGREVSFADMEADRLGGALTEGVSS